MKWVLTSMIAGCAILLLVALSPSPAVSDSGPSTRHMVLFHEAVPWSEIEAFAGSWQKRGVVVVEQLPLFNCLILDVPPSIPVEALANDSRVQRVERDQTVEMPGAVKGQYASFITASPAPPDDHYPWGTLRLLDQWYDPWELTSEYDQEELPDAVVEAYEALQQHAIKIALFDTGVQPLHRHLRKIVKGGINLVQPDAETGMGGVPLDDNGHGTHVAGIVAAALDAEGKWGRTAEVELYAVKILDHQAMGDLSRVVIGLQWAINHDIDIVNLSVGYREASWVIHRAIQVAHDAGIVLVASVGNHANWDESIILAADGGAADGGAADGGAADGGAADGGAADGGAADGGTDTQALFSVMYPAKYEEVIAVGASNVWGELAPYSNTGEEMDLMAPGSRVLSADVTNGRKRTGFGYCSGTSQSAAHVTAAAALMLALDPTLGPADIKYHLRRTAQYNGLNPTGEIDLTAALEDLNSSNSEIDAQTEWLTSFIMNLIWMLLGW